MIAQSSLSLRSDQTGQSSNPGTTSHPSRDAIDASLTSYFQADASAANVDSGLVVSGLIIEIMMPI